MGKEEEYSAADKAKVQAVLDDKKLPEKAEKGKSYVIFWADGRGVFAVKTKKAIRDWLEKTGSWAEIISIKYGDPEYKGKNLRVEDVIPVGFLLTEEMLQPKDLDLDKTYDIFKTSYEKQTGKAWDKGKFLDRIHGWTLYGDPEGFVATRQQASGPIKLVGAAGSMVGVKKGFQEVMALGKPIWGAMDLRLATISCRMGMKMPPAWIMKKVMNAIKDRLATANGVSPDSVTINDDGSMTIDYPDVGKATKFIVGNKKYFEWLLQTQGNRLPAILRTAISYFMTTGKPPPQPKDDEEDAGPV